MRRTSRKNCRENRCRNKRYPVENACAETTHAFSTSSAFHLDLNPYYCWISCDSRAGVHFLRFSPIAAPPPRPPRKCASHADFEKTGRPVMTPLRLLQVEDTEDDAILVQLTLMRAGYDVFARRVDTAEALRRELDEAEWDIVIADYTMPGFSGTKALALVRAEHPDLPFIFVSGTIGEDTAVAAMKTGAHDYIMKGNLKRLAPAVARELREAAVRRE